jgi:hypothetical protein
MPRTFDQPCAHDWVCAGEWECRYGSTPYYSSEDLAACITTAEAYVTDCATPDCAPMSDADALACYLDQVDCLAEGCARTFTNCCVAAAKDYIQCQHDNYVTATACVDAIDVTPCQTACDDARTACTDAPAVCDANYTTCMNGCEFSLNGQIYACTTGLPVCDLSAWSACAATESRRTDEETSGVDGRKNPLCFAATIECRKAAMDAFNSSMASVISDLVTAVQACYTAATASGDIDAYTTCRSAALVDYETAKAPIENTRAAAYVSCCNTWTKSKLDTGTDYDTAELECWDTYRLCLPGGDPGTCSDALTACLDSIPAPKGCTDCGSRANSSATDPADDFVAICTKVMPDLGTRFALPSPGI